MASYRGFLPENLVVYSRQAESFRKATGGNIRGRKAFAVNAESKSYKSTAQKWATAVSHLAPKGPNRMQMLMGVKKDIYVNQPNTPQTGLELISLEHRGEGGRAYKVRTQDGYVYDLREDALLESLLVVGMPTPGVLGGEWQWGVVGSQMKLVCLGTPLHKQLVAGTATRNANRSTKKGGSTKKVKTSELKVGGVYKMKSGEHRMFLGFCHSHNMSGKRQLAVYVSGRAPSTVLNRARTRLANSRVEEFSMVTSSSYTQEVGVVDVPDDVFAIVRAKAVAHFETSRSNIAATRNQNQQQYGYAGYLARQRQRLWDSLLTEQYLLSVCACDEVPTFNRELLESPV